MRAIARSANNDMFLCAGQLAMCDGKIAYAQIIEAAVLTVKGELQFDTEQGIPYFDTIFRSSKRAALWKAYVVDRVKQFSFVTSITQFDYTFDYKNHVINYVMRVNTDKGKVTITSVDYTVSTIGTHTSGEGEQLVQNGIFYLPVYMENSVQVYRQLKQYVDDSDGTVTTELSEDTYIKNASGVFVKQ